MKWEDFSEHLTHFTKPDPGNVSTLWGVEYDLSSAYDAFISICGSRRVRASNPFGIARRFAPEDCPQNAACLSEIPLHCLDRIVERRSRYGIGFTKEYARKHGALPIWYVEKDSEQYKSINALMKSALASDKPSAHPIWTMTPFIDAPGKYGKAKYRFEWEREWRVHGHFDFDESDVAFLILPEKEHARACGFFHQAREENTGPFYGCPFIDGNWNLKRIEKALAENWPQNEREKWLEQQKGSVG